MSKRPPEEELPDPRATSKPRDDAYPDTFRDNLANGGSLGACLREEMQSHKEALNAINEGCKLQKSPAVDEPITDALKAKMDEVRLNILQPHLAKPAPQPKPMAPIESVSKPLPSFLTSASYMEQQRFQSADDSSDDSSDDDGSSSSGSSSASVDETPVAAPSSSATAVPMSDDQFLALVDRNRCVPKEAVEPVPKMTGPGARPTPQQKLKPLQSPITEPPKDFTARQYGGLSTPHGVATPATSSYGFAGPPKPSVAAIGRNSADLDSLRQREAAAARAVGGAPNINDEGRGPSIDICFSAGSVVDNTSHGSGRGLDPVAFRSVDRGAGPSTWDPPMH